MKYQDHRVEANGVSLHVVSAGPEEGRLLIFLHGFPEFWYGWRKQIDEFAAQGYRVLVPDQRGYHLSDKPKRIEDYRLEKLGGDILNLMDWAQRSKAVVVGHDWGAAVAWWLAMNHPDRLEKLVILNVPHPAVMLKNLFSNWRQVLRSWYIFVFQIPCFPEWFLSSGQAKRLANSMKQTSLPNTFTSDELKEYRKAWMQPGAIHSMINWYRAALQHRPPTPKKSKVKVPTLILWGAQDRFLGREMAEQSLKFCETARLEILEDATHWIQHEKPHAVNEFISAFIQSG